MGNWAFTYELCAVHSLDEHSCLRKGNKSDLVKCLGVPRALPSTPNTTNIDSSTTLHGLMVMLFWILFLPSRLITVNTLIMLTRLLFMTSTKAYLPRIMSE